MNQFSFSRRSLLRTLGGSVFAGTLGKQATGTVRADETEWSQFGHDAQNTGYAQGHDGAAGALREQWQFGTSDQVWSSPAVVNETIYLGSKDGHVYALSALNGNEKWRFQTGDWVVSSPAVVGDTVYVGNNNRTLYALSVTDGSERWHFNSGEGGVNITSAAVAGDALYFGAHDATYALAASDGSERWNTETGLITSSPAVADDTVYVGSVDSTLYALNASDGTEQWRFQTNGEIQSSPVVVDDTVYIGGLDTNIYALDATDGTERWRFESGNRIGDSPAVADGSMFAATGKYVYAIDVEDGSEEWRFEMESQGSSSPTVADSTVYAGSTDGMVYALDSSDGTEHGRFKTDDTVWSMPVVVDETVYVGSLDGNVYALSNKASASISHSPADPTTDDGVTFTVEVETAGNATVTSYEWAFGSNAEFTAAGAEVSHTFENSGEHTVRLRITDSQGNTATAERSVEIAAAGSEQSTTDWPSFGYDAANTGYNPVASGPTEGVNERWRFETDDLVFSSPAVVDGTVYVGSSDSNLYAIAKDGTEQWHYQTGDQVDTSPEVHDGTVYVGSNDGNIYAVNATDGSEQWRFDTDPRHSPSSPTVAGDSVYFGSYDGMVYALDENGAERWRFETSDTIEASPAVAGEFVYVASNNANIYALDATEGTEQWRYETRLAIDSSPTVEDETVYFGSVNNSVYALNRVTGTREWQFETGGQVRSSPAVADGTVYVGSDDGNLYALDATDGSKQWQFETGGIVRSSPVVTDSVVYTGTRDVVFAVAVADGAEKWRFETGRGVYSSPAVVDGTLYVGSGNLYALEEGDRTLGSAGLRVPGFGYHLLERHAALGGAGLLTTGGLLAAGVRKVRGGSTPPRDPLTLWRQPGRTADNTASAPDCRPVTPDGDAWTSGDQASYPIHTGTVVVAGNDDGTLTATDPLTGTNQWTVALGEAETTPPTAAFDTVYAASGAELFAVGTDDGEIYWTKTLAGPVVGSPLPEGDFVYLAREDGTVSAHNGKTGAQQWTETLEGVPTGGVAVSDDIMLVGTDDQLLAFDPDDGEQRWSVGLGTAPAMAPVIVDDTGYVVGEDGTLHAINADGDELWTSETGYTPADRLVATGETVYLAGEDGSVVAFDTEGDQRWTADCGGQVSGSPALVGDTLYVPTAQQVVGLDAATGEELWTTPLSGQPGGLAPTSDALYVATDAGLEAYPDENLDDEDWGAAFEDVDDEDSDAVDDTAVGDESTNETEADPNTDDDAQFSDTPAEQFAHQNDRIESARPLEVDGPIHVYEGELSDVSRSVCIQALAPDHVDNDDAVAAFTQAAQRWGSISHNPYIATVYDSGEDPRPWVAYDAGDRSLVEAVDDLDRDDRLRVLDSIFEGLDTASLYNISHTALSPETVVLVDEEDGMTAELTDWGLDREVTATLDDSRVTPYTAPEQLDGETAPTTDVYRAGLLAYWLLTEHEPLAGADDLQAAIRGDELVPPSSLADLPDTLEEVIADAIAEHHDDRYDSVLALRDAIQGVLS